jgi:hypothetical protein
MVALGWVIGHHPPWVSRTWAAPGFTESRRTGRPRVAPTAARSWSSWGPAAGQLPTSCRHHPGWRLGHAQLCCPRRRRRVRPEGAARPGKAATHEDLRRPGRSQEPCLTVGVLHAGRELTRDGARAIWGRPRPHPTRIPHLAGAAGGHAGGDGLSGYFLAAAGDAPRRAPRYPAGSHHLVPPIMVVMVAVIAWLLQPPSPWRAAPWPPRPPAARSRPGPAG